MITVGNLPFFSVSVSVCKHSTQLLSLSSGYAPILLFHYIPLQMESKKSFAMSVCMCVCMDAHACRHAHAFRPQFCQVALRCQETNKKYQSCTSPVTLLN